MIGSAARSRGRCGSPYFANSAGWAQVSEFIARYPQIRVRLLLSDSNADLVDDHIDLAVQYG
jgi:DNA-binding transcriptional LysR family regulator